MTERNRSSFLVLRSLAILSLIFPMGLDQAAADINLPHPDAPIIERVRIPAGEFAMGADNQEPDEGPLHTVYLDDYEIGTFEVTWEQYQAFIDAGGYENIPTNGYWSTKGAALAGHPFWNIDDVPGQSLTAPRWTPAGGGPPGFADRGHWPPKPNDPVVGLSIWETQAFCKFVGGRLPTEAEWEKAAAWGPNASSPSTFPWGEDASTPMPANGFEVSEGYSMIDEVDAARYEGDVSAYGVRGMGGNVSELVGDMYDPEYYSQGPEGTLSWTNPFNFLAKRLDIVEEVGSALPLDWTIRGGKYTHNTADGNAFRNTNRDKIGVLSRDRQVGFRVAWDVTPEPVPTPVVREDPPGSAVAIPGGNYLIGHTMGVPSEVGSAQAEHPQHGICLNGYWIGKYE